MKKYILMAAAVLAMAVSCNKANTEEPAAKKTIDDVVLTNGKITYSVNIEAPNGYQTTVNSKSEIEAVIAMMGDDSTYDYYVCNALYNSTKCEKGVTAIEKTKTDTFMYVLGGNDIRADETYYIAVVALDENGEFKNEDAVIVTYPEAK